MKKVLLIILLFYVAIPLNAQALALVREDKLFGYINNEGQYEIEPQFQSAKSFSEGLAAVKKDGKWGFIDRTGSWVIEAEYDRVKRFDSGIALVLVGDYWSYVKSNGDGLSTPYSDKYYDFVNGAAIYRRGDKVGFIDIKGNIIVQATYEKVTNFINGYAKVKKDGLWGLIDMEGAVYVPIEYAAIGNYHENGLWARKDETNGVIVDEKFHIVAGAVRVWDFHGFSKLARARNFDGYFGFIDGKGQWVILPDYKEVLDFNKGLAPVAKTSSNWGFINESNEVIVPFKYKTADRFSHDGLAPVSDKKNANKREAWGFINTEGKLVIPMRYALQPYRMVVTPVWEKKGFHNGFARVKRLDKWAFLKPNGPILGNKWFENAEYFE